MIIRLLQKFEAIDLDIEAQPAEWRVKPEWAEKESYSGFAREKIIIKTNLTLFAPVRMFLFPKVAYLLSHSQGGVWVKLSPASSTT